MVQKYAAVIFEFKNPCDISVYKWAHSGAWCGRYPEWCDTVGEVVGVESVGRRSAEHAHDLCLLQDDWDHDRGNYMYAS